jgi:guanylate kinase
MKRLLARFCSMATTTATSSTLFEVPQIRVAPQQLQQLRQVLPHRHAAHPQAVEARLQAAEVQQQAMEALQVVEAPLAAEALQVMEAPLAAEALQVMEAPLAAEVLPQAVEAQHPVYPAQQPQNQAPPRVHH